MSASKPPNLEPTRVESPDDGQVVPSPAAPSPAVGPSINETPAMPADWVPPPTPAVSGDPSASKRPVQSIGKFRVEKQLGEGGFGAVYLAMDDELNRRVAIKVPKRMAAAQVAEYREEAQKLARLEHPGVVPIYEIGHTAEYPVFLVTKFLEGGTLTDWVHNARPDFLAVARLIAAVAEALHATHLKGIFHRDIKPANILVDAHGKPFLADFGLALTEGHGLDAAPEILGTPAYMSPEQAAGEGHRVDGQTDIFSLGVVLYELLAGVRPFRSSEKLSPREQISQLLELVKTFDPRPPRQVNDDVPKELERICLKALAKRKPDRYTTARDMAEDLKYFAANPAAQEAASVRVQLPSARDSSTQPQTPTPGAASTPQVISDREPLKIVPKGLRSFDAGDASFFLDLLPGPRDRDGLPESIRFWKTRIESPDPEITFSSGVLYGPSGCGKSSLVKAGLIPHLAGDIVPIYLEATGDDTELRLSRAIRRACPEFGDDLSLTLLLKNLRRGVGLPSGKKALIVLDQFEQWLHAKRGLTNQELPAALRQCDGERVQCLILVRDDFWLAISRFLEELEIPLIQGRNCALADRFDPPHARKVLDAFGVAFGKVGWDSVPTNPPAGPRNAGQAGRDGVPTYNAFLDQSIAALSEEGKIISVRLALFAEMVKSKPWTPQTLQAIGGVEGVGVTFLEETFSASNAPMAYRAHQVAVRGVLKALLPEIGTDIKGHRVSRDTLLQASGYVQHPRDFDSLLRILDRDLRLITPVDAEGEWGREGEGVKDETKLCVSPSPTLPLTPSSSYQLAHDYLVPSIRAWLTKKQRETWRGRAELRLEERSVQWQRTRERRHLPSLFEYTTIVCGVARRQRSVEQRRMMRAATRHHAMRWGSLLLLLLATVFGIDRHLAERRRVDDDAAAKRRVDDLARAPADAVPVHIETLEALRPLAIPKLRTLLADAQAKPSHRLHAAYALAAFGDTSSKQTLIDAILDNVATADGSEAKNMVVALRELSRLGFHPDRSGWNPNLQNALHDNIAARIQSLPVQSTADSEGLPVRLRFAALALYLGDESVLSPLVQLGPDPTERTALTLRLKDWPPDDLSSVREILATTSDEPLCSVLCAALGKFPKPADPDHDALVGVLKERFVNAPDGGTHSAIDWTLRQWGVAVPDVRSHHAPRDEPQPDTRTTANQPAPERSTSNGRSARHAERDGYVRRWSVNSAGMTLVEIPAGKHQLIKLEFKENKEEESPYEVELTHSVSLSNREVSVAQFQAFVNDPNTPAAQKPEKWQGHEKQYSPTDECPVQQVNWFDAVLYCNWLSRKEGLSPCYQTTEKKLKLKNYDNTEYEAEDWQLQIAADGYRLPTEAEWEAACRARTTTAWSCGQDEVALSDFAVFVSNSRSQTSPGGTKLPNGFGLFDAHGNVYEWCHDWYGEAMTGGSDPRGPATGQSRLLRGGSFNVQPQNARSAVRNDDLPTLRNFNFGFRLARTKD